MFNIVKASVKERIDGKPLETRSRIEFQKLISEINNVEQNYIRPQRRIITPLQIVEAHKWLTHLLKTGLNLYYETDTLRPTFVEVVNPNQKVLGDNPDAFYFNANLDIEQGYIITGQVNDEAYFSLTVYRASCRGCFSNDVLSDVNHRNLIYDDENLKTFTLYAGGYKGIPDEYKDTIKNYLPLTTKEEYEEYHKFLIKNKNSYFSYKSKNKNNNGKTELEMESDELFKYER